MATHAQRGSLWRVGAGALFVAAALCGGCSVLFHADAKQCSATTDCTARGTAFTGYTCNLGTCVAPECTKNTDCASFGLGYTCSTKFVCVAPVAMLDGGNEAEAAVVGCSTSADCTPVSQTHIEVACDVSTRTCIQLTSDECPILIPSNIWPLPASAAPPIFLGAFVTLPTGGPLTHPTYLNYALALNEFKMQSGGIPAGPGTGSRTPIAVGCDLSLDTDKAMQHLINDVHVSSVVAPLPSTTLSHVFQTYAYPSNIFMINPLGADSNLTSLTVGSPPLLWHMLGTPGDNAPAYGAFLPLLERYIRANAPWNLPSGTPMKVATVTAASTVTTDLAAAVKKVLTWNGGLTTGQNGANYLDELISDSTLNGTSLSSAAFSMSIQKAAMDLAQFEPDVIISFASDEFAVLIQDVELDWNGGVPLPFYLVGPYNMGSTSVQGTVGNLPFNTRRFAGIGVAATTDLRVLTDYENRFILAYPGREDALGAENLYDAMYFAVDSLIAAGRVTTPDVATGMTHLISSISPQFEVGPAAQGSVFSTVGGSTRGSIDLIGTLGPPDFDAVTGARIGEGDVYCFQDTDAGTPTPKFAYDYDVLRLNSPDGGASPDGGSPFQGTFPCYPGIQ